MSVFKRFGILALFVGSLIACFMVSPLAFADDEGSSNCVDTAILGNGGEYCDDGSGSGVLNLLGDVVDILSVGVGILGVLGITIVGIQYLTAGDNEEKTRKAKRRMLEIVIGLVAYILIYAILKWLNVAPR